MTPHMTIGGERAAARAHFAVINPATEEPLDDAPACQRDQLDAAFEAALKAFPAWSNDEDTRLAMLAELADRIVEAGPELVDLLMLESGKPRDLAEIEISACKMW